MLLCDVRWLLWIQKVCVTMQCLLVTMAIKRLLPLRDTTGMVRTTCFPCPLTQVLISMGYYQVTWETGGDHVTLLPWLLEARVIQVSRHMVETCEVM